MAVKLSQVGLRFVLGNEWARPEVGELHGFVSQVACLSGFDWILEAEPLMWSRDL